MTVFACVVLGGALIEANDETKRLAYFAVSEMPKLKFPYPTQAFELNRGSAYFVDSARAK